MQYNSLYRHIYKGKHYRMKQCGIIALHNWQAAALSVTRKDNQQFCHLIGSLAENARRCRMGYYELFWLSLLFCFVSAKVFCLLFNLLLPLLCLLLESESSAESDSFISDSLVKVISSVDFCSGLPRDSRYYNQSSHWTAAAIEDWLWRRMSALTAKYRRQINRAAHLCRCLSSRPYMGL